MPPSAKLVYLVLAENGSLTQREIAENCISPTEPSAMPHGDLKKLM